MATKLGEVRKRIDDIEACYEFLLAYAAQGLPGDEGSPVGGQLRDFLRRAEQALDGLADVCRAAGEEHAEGVGSFEDFLVFVDALERDAQTSLALVRMILARPSISSQLIDNLNASIHLRALLTDLFVLDEVLPKEADPSSAPN